MLNNNKTGSRTLLRASVWISAVAAVAIGVGACGASGTKDSTAASAVSPTTQTGAAAATGTPATPAPVPSTQVPATTPATKPASSSKATTVVSAAASHTPATTAPAPTPTTPAPTTPALPARTQPTAAQVNQVIASVHALVPLFTPTAAEINTAGNEVCTAFDQGKTVAQIKTTAMQMAGPYAILIPASTVNTAVKTIVTMYCPGYASRLA
jgi:hypothetical protein